MSRRVLHHSYVVDPYGFHFGIIVGQSRSRVVSLLSGKYNIDTSGSLFKEAEAISLQTPDDKFVIAVLQYPDCSEWYHIQNIAHECLHIAWYILDHAGVILSVNNHEAQTYLMTHLMGLVAEQFHKYERLIGNKRDVNGVTLNQ